MTHDPAGLLGLRKVDGVPAPGNQGHHGLWHQAGEPERVRGEADVVRPGHGQYGAGERRKTVPDGLLRARPAQPEARRQAGRGVAQALRAPCSTPVETFEHGTMEPGVDEVLHIARGLELVSHGVVGLAPCRPGDRILNSRGHADEDDTTQGQIGADRHMQRHPGTERVAEQGTGLVTERHPRRLGHETRRRRQVGPHGPGIPVAGEVDRDHGVRLGQELSEAAPEAPGLGEAVQHDQRRSGPVHIDMEGHAG